VDSLFFYICNWLSVVNSQISTNMKRIYLFATVSVCCLFSLYAQEHPAPSVDLIMDRFETQVDIYPQEKLYLHLDRTYFFQGEVVWMKAYLTDAYLQPPVTGTRYIYVDLINPLNSIVRRVMIVPEENLFYGNLPLPDDLAEGVYTLRAYTRYMENMGEDAYFRKTIRVKSILASQIRPHYTYNYDKNNKKINIDLYYTSGLTETKIKPDKLGIRNHRGLMQNVRVDRDTIAHFSYDLPLKQRVCYVEADNFKHFIPLPDEADDYHISFFPEGGYLLSGTPTRVAFKAVNSAGLSEEITGTVYNGKGEPVTSVKTVHAGMGLFGVIAGDDAPHYMECVNRKNHKKRFELPKGMPGMYGISTVSRADRLFIGINKSSDISLQEDLYLLIHDNREIYFVDRLDPGKQSKFFSWNLFPSGILRVMLLDKQMNPLSERLVFSPVGEEPELLLQTDKEKYSTRDKVSLTLQLHNYAGDPVNGNMSVAITDDRDVSIDSLQTIISTLLLSSELKGYIESPGYYFNPANPKAEPYLDLLLMTQGWRRYDIPKVIKGEYTYPAYMAEESLAISGKVTRLTSEKPIGNGEVTLMLTSTDGGTFIDQTFTNEKGLFVFDRMDYSDSAKVFIQSLNVKGKDHVALTMDEISYPSLSDLDRFQITGSPKGEAKADNPEEDIVILKKAEERAKYDENMQVINLKEITVTAQDKSVRPAPATSVYASMNTVIIDFAEKMERRIYTHFSDVFYEIAGVQVVTDDSGNKRLLIRGGTMGRDPYAAILMDNMLTGDPGVLDNLNVFDVATIEVYKGSDATIFGMNGSNGVVNIILKKGGEGIKEIPTYNKVSTTLLGAQKPVEFYTPRYETPEQKSNYLPDLRTTIYWKPDVRVNEEGKAELEFYTADIPSGYSVVVEGLTGGGMPVRQVGKILVE